MNKNEAKWQIPFNQYLRASKHYGYFELKYTIKDYLPFSSVRIGQYMGLQSTEKHGFVWKWSDMDMREKPIDCACLPPLPSYLVIRFKDAFYMMRINDVVKLRDSGKVAITLEDAKQYSEKVVIC